MAFQVGTQIRPELGRADLSGFERSGQYLGQAIANVGAQIGEGIEKHYKKKKDADDKRASFDFLKQTGAFGDISDEALMAGINSVGAGNLVNLQQTILASQATRQATEQSASLFPTQKELQEQNLLRQKQIFEQGAEAFPLQQELQEQNLLRQQQVYGQSAEAFPLQQQVTQAQLEGMTAGEQRAAAAAVRAQELFPFQLESLQANIASTKQGTEASKAGVSMAKRKQVLSEKLAKQTQEQNEKDYNLKVEELRLKVGKASQRDPVSKKKLDDAQTFLDENGLIMVDGAIYEKTGWFGGKAVEVINPAILNLEGMEDLRRISIDMQSVPSNAASEDFEGFSIQSEGADGQPVASDAAVSTAALDSVAQPRPEGSRIERSADSILQGLENMRESSLEFGKGTKVLPFAIADYLFSSDNPSFDVSKARARSRTAPFFQ